MSDRPAAAPRGHRREWGQITLWGARVAWLAAAVIGGRAVGDAVASRDDAVQLVATVGAWVGWAAGALALAVPSLSSLTAVRAIVPAAIVVAGVTAVVGAPGASVLALAVPAAVASLLVGAADTGSVYVQTSAYGDERRFLLRPPVGYLAACVVSWAVWVAAVLTAPLTWASGALTIATVSSVVAAALTWLLPSRWHQLTRRWVVTVPAGLVVHDLVVLAESLMLPRRQIVEMGLVGRHHGSAAFDLTGPTPGVAVGIVLDEQTTIVLAPRPGMPRGRVIHLSALLVAPSRPGAVLRESARRRLPVR